MTNGLLEKAKEHNKPNEAELLDICSTPDNMILSAEDFIATFCLILTGYVFSTLLLGLEHLKWFISFKK